MSDIDFDAVIRGVRIAEVTEALVVATIRARSLDEAAAELGRLADPLPEDEQLQVMTGLAGSLTNAIVMMRAGIPGVSGVLDSMLAIYAAGDVVRGAEGGTHG